MAKKKAPREKPNTDGWLATYADMITLLMTFFLLLYSMSSVDSSKFNQVVIAFTGEGEETDRIILRGEIKGDRIDVDQPIDLEGLKVENLEEIFKHLQAKVIEEQMQDNVEISQGEGFVFVRFMDNMLFEPNSSELKPNDRDLLKFVGESIKSLQDETTSINIVGHTAAIPNNPDYEISDRKLSTQRANEVLIYFEDVIGIEGSKLFATGYGKWKPIAENDTEIGRSQNRRVEILISKEGNSLSEQLDNAYEKLVE